MMTSGRPWYDIMHGRSQTESMESIGKVVSATDDIHSCIIPLFGIVSTTASNNPEQCYFCFEDMEHQEPIATTMPCCSQHAHSYCLKTWIQQCRLHNTNIRCGYYRAPTNYDQTCIMCLQKLYDQQQQKQTKCCKMYIHAKCAIYLQQTLDTLPFKHTLECGICDCLWHHL